MESPPSTALPWMGRTACGAGPRRRAEVGLSVHMQVLRWNPSVPTASYSERQGHPQTTAICACQGTSFRGCFAAEARQRRGRLKEHPAASSITVQLGSHLNVQHHSMWAVPAHLWGNCFHTCVLKEIVTCRGFAATHCINALVEHLPFSSRGKMSCPMGPEWENSVS